MNERRKGYLKGYSKGRRFDLSLWQYVLFGIAVGVSLSLVAVILATNL